MPYQSDTYGRSTSSFLLHGPVGAAYPVDLPASHDPFTGLDAVALRLRRTQFWNPVVDERVKQLYSVLMNGAAWEADTAEIIASLSTKSTKKPKKVFKKQLRFFKPQRPN